VTAIIDDSIVESGLEDAKFGVALGEPVCCGVFEGVAEFDPVPSWEDVGGVFVSDEAPGFEVGGSDERAVGVSGEPGWFGWGVPNGLGVSDRLFGIADGSGVFEGRDGISDGFD
jgi:hypothetical protein